MGLFGKDPLKHGRQTPGTAERIVITHTDDGDEHRTARRQGVILTFAFADEQGVPVQKEHRFMLHFAEIPAPGSAVTVAYIPGSDRHIDFNQTGLPDPDVPRGWSAGVFTLDGGRQAHGFFGRHGIGKQLDLFRSGHRTTAEIVAVDASRWSQQAAWKTRLELQADGRQLTAEAWLPVQCTPEPGDLIEIAVGANGKDVALDTDPRWDGPPGQAIVFRTPPAVAAQRVPKQQFWGNRAPWGSESDLQDLMSSALGAVGTSGNGFAAFRVAPGQPPATFAAQTDPASQSDPATQMMRLAQLLRDGSITSDEFDAMQARVLRGE